MPFSKWERHSGFRELHLFNHTRVDGEAARALGVVKTLARKVSEVGNQALPIPSPPGANLYPR
eukprot:8836075-Lingulodinium_polyedra.AAC.1